MRGQRSWFTDEDLRTALRNGAAERAWAEARAAVDREIEDAARSRAEWASARGSNCGADVVVLTFLKALPDVRAAAHAAAERVVDHVAADLSFEIARVLR